MTTNIAKRFTVSVDITSDVICPWCLVGLERFKQAVENVKNDIDVKYRFKPFMLGPKIPDDGMLYLDYFRQKGRNITMPQMKQMFAGL